MCPDLLSFRKAVLLSRKQSCRQFICLSKTLDFEKVVFFRDPGEESENNLPIYIASSKKQFHID